MHSTAADLWRSWLRSGVLRPQDYDRDLADAIRRQLGPSRTRDLARAMDRAEWTPRDLLQAIAPDLDSFSGMLRDLLRLYEKVGARSATGENLLISYEFDENDPFDVLLSSFREQEESARRVSSSGSGITFRPDDVFQNPAREFGDWDAVDRLFGPRPDEWPFARGAPRFDPTGHPRTDAVVGRGMRMVDAVMATLARLGPTRAEVAQWVHESGAEGTVAGNMARAAHDYCPLMTTAALHGLADAVRNGSVEPGMLDELDAWLTGFESKTELETLVSDVTDLLSLPSWGKRHELYSAWISTQFDLALAVDRAEFRVVDGALRFPFKATLLAEIVAAGGAYELWCEMRTDLVDPVSRERLRGIQPDFRILRREPTGGDATVLAVEVKQYRRGAAGRHGRALARYAAGLPGATVLLVGHGPLGKTVRDKVPVADRSRTVVFEGVRPGRPDNSAAFRAEIERLLPPPPATLNASPATGRRPSATHGRSRELPTRFELRWGPSVHDLDLHVRFASGETSWWDNLSTPDGALQRDAFDGGPEVVLMSPDAGPPVEVMVKLYSRDVASVFEANAEVTVRWADGGVQRLRPRGLTADPREWRVCRVEENGFVVSTETTVVT